MSRGCASRPGSRTRPATAGAPSILFESVEAARQELPSRARDLIGKEPDLVEEFDVEATIEGRFAEEGLSRLGLAFE